MRFSELILGSIMEGEAEGCLLFMDTLPKGWLLNG